MERGTPGERAAVRERWAAIERRRRLATRLVASVFLLTGGVVALLVAGASGRQICLVGRGLPGVACDGIVPPTVAAPLVVLGAVAVGVGLWGCLRSVRD